MDEGGDWETKRQFARVDVSFPLKFLIRSPLEARMDFGPEYQDGIAQDLSEGGIALVCDYPVPEGAVLSLKFSLLNPDISPTPHAFDLSADVRYRVKKERGYRSGIRFLNLPEEDRHFLSKYVRFLQSRSDF